MKRTVKKNQIVIAALTILLGVAGYINFSGNTLDVDDDKDKITEAAFANTDPEEISANELAIEDIETEEHIELNSDENEIGEAVLTSVDGNVTNIVSVKLGREQERSKLKENYLDIINGDGMDELSVEAAREAYIKMTEDMEKETETETILGAKGYENSIVSIGENTVDVVICADNLSDEDRAKIEDVVVRKVGCTVDQIVITTVK